MKTSLRTFILLIMAFAGAAGALAATVRPSDKYVTREVKTGDFDALRTITSLDIVYTVGPRKVEIYAPDNLIEYIDVEVHGKELNVKYKENMNIRGKHKSYVKVSAPAVKSFTTTSSGDIEIKSPISLKNEFIALNTTSAGDIEALSINAKGVAMGISSAGDIEAQDILADVVDISIISSGDIEIKEVVAGTEVKATTNSAGDIKIGEISAPTVSLYSNSAGDIRTVVKADKANIATSSSGDITVSGICSTANLASASSGNVDARELKAAVVNVHAASSGDIYCWALKKLVGCCIGSGAVRYKKTSAAIDITRNRNSDIGPL